MPKAIYIAADGSRTEVDVPLNTSLMQAAVSNGINEIVGDCGGSASCATCHVYVDERFLSTLPEIHEDEAEMLQATACERKPNSRLSCQIKMTTELDGIVVYMPEEQW